jgi:hypothetical protein
MQRASLTHRGVPEVQLCASPAHLEPATSRRDATVLPLRAAAPERPSWLRAVRWERVLAAVPALVFAGALLVFVRAQAAVEVVLPRTQTSVADASVEHNLVAAALGPTIRTSSYWNRFEIQHHPAFVVDSVRTPTLTEKWVSAPADRAPWIELIFPHAAELMRVVIRHAGSVEEPKSTVRNYRIRCLTERPSHLEVQVRDNQASVRSHDLHCIGARGVRLEFDPKGLPGDVVRIYEIEALGR